MANGSSLGDFFVGLGIQPRLEGMQKFSSYVGSSLKKLLITAGALETAISAVGIGLVKMLSGTAKETAELGRQAQYLDVNVQSLDKFQKMFELAGGNAQDAINIIDTLNAKLALFKIGEYDEFLGKALQLAPQDFTGNFVKDLDTIKKRLELIWAPNERKAILDNAGLGEASRLLLISSERYNDIAKKAESTGLATKSMVKSSQEFTDKIIQMTQAWRQFKRELTANIGPQFSKTMDEIKKVLGNKEFKQNITEFFNNLLEILPSVVKGIGFVVKGMGFLFKMINVGSKKFEEMNADADAMYFNEKMKNFKKNNIDNFKATQMQLAQDIEDFSKSIPTFTNIPTKNISTSGNVTNHVNVNVNVNKTNASTKDIAKSSEEGIKKGLKTSIKNQNRGNLG